MSTQTLGKRTALSAAAMVVLSVFLGIASGFGHEGFAPGAALINSLILAGAMVFFFLVLPRFVSQPIQILLGMVIGVVAGWLFTQFGMTVFAVEYIGIFGTLFLLLLKVVVIPLIFVSILCGVAGMGDTARLGRLGGKAMVYYMATTCFAVMAGMLLVQIVQPGTRVEDREVPAQPAAAGPEAPAPSPGAGEADAQGLPELEKISLGRRIQERILPRIVQNPIMAGQDTLVIIFFALLLGTALAVGGAASAPVLTVLEGLNKAFIKIVLWIMLLAPIGVFALIADAFCEMGVDFLAGLAMYTLTVLLGLALHWCVLVFVFLGLVLRVSPGRFIRGMAPALQLAFSTSSSSATLPVTIDCATRRVGVDEDTASFVLPIGATVNMDGTAMYLAIASIFIAEVYGLSLDFNQQLAIFLTAVTMSVGAAGIPGAALPLITAMLLSAGLPIEGAGLVAGVDRFLDMCRTFLNVSGDAVGAVAIAKSEGTLGEPPGEALD